MASDRRDLVTFLLAAAFAIVLSAVMASLVIEWAQQGAVTCV